MKPALQRALFVLVAAAALAGGVWVGQYKNAPQPAAAPAPNAAQKLASLTLPDLEGKAQSFGQWQGKKWVVNFWATWCTPCREEMPMLAELARQHEGAVQFLGIGIDTPEEMAKFARETPVPYPLLVGGNDIIELTAQLGNTAMALPFTVVLDERGTVIGQRMGRISEAQLQALLGPHTAH